MGCDIHLVLEQRRKDGGWVAIDTFKGHETLDGWRSPIARSRNYHRFALLAGVRGDGPKPLGVPDDISETTKHLIEGWGGDGHSHSWASLKEASAVFLASEHNPSDMAKQYPDSHFFGVDTSYRSGAHASDYRLVFWFDN